MSKARIKFRLVGELLDAYKAVSIEYEKCGKSAKFPDNIMRLSDESFICVYNGICKATSNSVRYPKKSGKEYLALFKLLKFLENEYLIQRGEKFVNNIG